MGLCATSIATLEKANRAISLKLRLNMPSEGTTCAKK